MVSLTGGNPNNSEDMSLTFIKRIIKGAVSHGAILLLLTCFLPNNYAQADDSVIGKKASANDPRVYRAIEESVRLKNPKWRLLEHFDSAPGTAYWEWKNGKKKVRLYVSFLASQADAALMVKYTLAGVALPRYSPMNVGDEGYLDGDDGWALFRINSLVISVDARKMKADAINGFAEQIAGVLRATSQPVGPELSPASFSATWFGTTMGSLTGGNTLNSDVERLPF